MGGGNFIDHLNPTEFIEQFVHNCQEGGKNREEEGREGESSSKHELSYCVVRSPF